MNPNDFRTKKMKNKVASVVKLKRAREKMREAGMLTRHKYVSITCTKCQKEIHIHINPGTEQCFTQDVKAKFVCCICKGRK